MTTRDLDPGDAGARRLGALAEEIQGEVSAAEHAAGRERFAITAHTTKPVARRWLVPLVAAALAATLAGAFTAVRISHPSPLEYSVSGPLIADGEWLGVAPDQGALSFRFSEGTEVELAPNARGRVTELSPDGARVVLGTGRLSARVVHRPHTRWTVDAGPYAIEVTGTAFDVAWDGARLQVSLHDGSVMVRGPSFPSGVRVAAGQRLITRRAGGPAEVTSLLAPEPPAASAAPSPAENAPPKPAEAARAPARAAPTWPELVASGDFHAVLAAAEARGIDASLRGGSLADVAALSDAARYSGNRPLSRRGLLAQRTRFPASSEARAAAFVLGRLSDEDGASQEAVRWYDTYLREAPRGSFASEALGRKVVSLSRSGGTEAARTAARGYLDRYPRGAHAAYARELLSRP